MKKEFFKIMKKDFLLFWRSKNSMIAILIGPLMIIFLIALAFNNSQPFKLTLGFYVTENSSVDSVKHFIDRLGEDFKVILFDSEAECIEWVKYKGTSTCLVFDSANNKTKVSVHIDYTKINLAWLLLNYIQSDIGIESSKISINRTNILLDELEKVQQVISNNSRVVKRLEKANNDSQVRLHQTDHLLESMEFDFDIESIDIKNIEGKLDNLRKSVTTSKEDVHDIISKVENLDNVNQSDKENIKEYIEEIENNLLGIIDIAYPEIDSIIDDVKSNLSAADSMIENDHNMRENALIHSGKLEINLKKDSEEIDEIKNSLKEMNSSIASIKIRNAEEIINPLETEVVSIIEGNHLKSIFPVLLILIIMFTGLLLSSTLVVIEKKSKAFLRNMITPVEKYLFMLSFFITNLIILSMQIFVFLFISFAFLGIDLPNISIFALIILLIISIFILIGIFVGRVLNSANASSITSITLGCLMFFFSGTILPMESMPESIAALARYNPLVISESLLRKVFFHKVGFEIISNELWLLIIYILVLVIIIVLIVKIRIRDISDFISELVFEK